MGHNNVVLSHPKSNGILRVDGLSTGPPNLGCHISFFSVFTFVHSCIPMTESNFILMYFLN